MVNRNDDSYLFLNSEIIFFLTIACEKNLKNPEKQKQIDQRLLNNNSKLFIYLLHFSRNYITNFMKFNYNL